MEIGCAVGDHGMCGNRWLYNGDKADEAALK